MVTSIRAIWLRCTPHMVTTVRWIIKLVIINTLTLLLMTTSGAISVQLSCSSSKGVMVMMMIMNNFSIVLDYIQWHQVNKCRQAKCIIY